MGRRVVVGLLIGSGLLVVLDAVAVRLGVAPGALPRVEGTSAWVTSRAAGITAFLALTLDVLFGLLVSTGAADRLVPRHRSVEIHRWLSSVALALIAVHALALTADRFVRFDVLDAMVPFLSSYRPVAVGLGILAAHAALAIHLSFGLRKRIGVKAWRAIHSLSFFAFAAALVHGVFAGTDSGTPLVRAMYLAAGAAVGGLVLLRLATAARASGPPARSTPGVPGALPATGPAGAQSG